MESNNNFTSKFSSVFTIIFPSLFNSRHEHQKPQKQLSKKDSLNNNKFYKCPVCCLVLENYLARKHSQSHPSKIFDWMYLGSYDNSINKNDLNKLKIKYVLNCTHECKSIPHKNIKYKQIKLFDNPQFDIKQYLQSAFSFINEAKENKASILIHCAMGISRSSAIVIAYIMKEQKITYKQAFWFVKQKRSIAFPNLGFVEQLTKYQDEIL